MQKVEHRVQQIRAIKRIEIARVVVSALGFLVGIAGNALAAHDGVLKWHDPIIPLCWGAMFVFGIASVRSQTSLEKLEIALARILAEREAFYVDLGIQLDRLRNELDINKTLKREIQVRGELQ